VSTGAGSRSCLEIGALPDRSVTETLKRSRVMSSIEVWTEMAGLRECKGQSNSNSNSVGARSGRGRRPKGVWRIARFRVLLQRASAAHPCAACAEPGM